MLRRHLRWVAKCPLQLCKPRLPFPSIIPRPSLACILHDSLHPHSLAAITRADCESVPNVKLASIPISTSSRSSPTHAQPLAPARAIRLTKQCSSQWLHRAPIVHSMPSQLRIPSIIECCNSCEIINVTKECSMQLGYTRNCCERNIIYRQLLSSIIDATEFTSGK